MGIRLTVSTLVVAVALFGAANVAAQDVGLSQVLVDLIQSDIRLAPPTAPNQSHEAHFLPGTEQRIAPFLFNQAIVTELSSFSIGSSSGGFSYAYDAALGTFTRSTTSFGPSLAERPNTVGRRRLTIGANYQFSSYNSFEGEDLGEGAIKFYLRHEESGTQPFFEGDIIEAALRLELSKHSFVMFGSYGVTDRLELGLAVPVVSVDMDATVDASILRLATAAIPGIHRFPNGGTTEVYTAGGSASGIGDILIRAKYQVKRAPNGGLAIGVDLRAPTGDEHNLLGTGAAQAKVLLIGSATRGTLSPHFNVGVTLSGDSDSPFVSAHDELNYVGGVEYAPSSRVTIAADFIGRTLRDAGRLGLQDKTFAYMTNTGQTGSATYPEFALNPGNLHLSYGAVGAKVNPTRNLVLSFNALIPLTKAGMRANITPVVGFDYTF
jgi:hypothetical protein